MSFLASLPAEDLGRYFGVIKNAVDINTHFELLQWLQGDLQQYLPHEIMIAAWGDFHLGLIRHDIVSNLPGVRTEFFSADLLHPCLREMFDHWVVTGRKAISLIPGVSGFNLAGSSINCSLAGALKGMRSSLIHGISDERGSHDCLYVLFSARVEHNGISRSAMQTMLPYLDTALRKIAHLPRQRAELGELAAPPAPRAPAGGVLTGREKEIVSWVRQGKTNYEIGRILDISEFTVKNHLQRVFKKLGVFNRTQAVTKFEKSEQLVRI